MTRVVRFLCAGAVGVSLGYLTLYGLTEWFGMWYVLSAVFGFLVNLASNFVLQRNWTFKSESLDIHRQFLQYAILYGTLFTANMAILYGLTEYANLWYMVAQFIASIVCTVISFFASRRIFA